MVKLIVLKIHSGNFNQGFEVNIRVEIDGSKQVESDCQLPEAPDIPQLYDSWRSNYAALEFQRRGIELGRTYDVGKLHQCCDESAQNLRKSIKLWLQNPVSAKFQNLREILREQLAKSQERQEEVRVFIQTQETLLHKIPWQEWDIFYHNSAGVEIALCPPNFQSVPRVPLSGDRVPIGVLAILGDSRGTNVDADREFLANRLPDAKVEFLVEPEQLKISDFLWDNDCNILFFAGHSSSESGTGRIYNKPNEYLTVDNLKPGLREAIKKGLHLAIFNSCDGLQLATALAELNIPQVIVMREPVPDKIAQRFLKYFLTAFSRNRKSLYLAVWEARERLLTDGSEREFPGASWLPIICQNPAEVSLVWPEPKPQYRPAIGKFKELRQQLLLDKSLQDLRETLYRVEQILETDPNNPDGRLLKDEIEQAIKSDAARLTSKKQTWRCVHSLATHTDAVKSVAISPDGETLASGSLDKTIRLWDLDTGVLLHTLTGHSSAVLSIAFSPDGKTLASASNMEFQDGTIKFWDVAAGKIKQSLGRFPIALRTSCVAFSPDGTTMASGHIGTTVIGATVQLWNPNTGKIQGTLKGHGWEVNSLAFSKDGRILISGGLDGAIKIWNWRKEELLHTLNRPSPSDFVGSFVSWFDSSVGAIWSVAISPDGKTVASGGSEQPIKLWNAENGRLLRTFTEHSDSIYSLAFNPDGETLASGGGDNKIMIWNFHTGELLQTLEHLGPVKSVAFSSDGKTLVSGSADATVKVWRVPA